MSTEKPDQESPNLSNRPDQYEQINKIITKLEESGYLKKIGITAEELLLMLHEKLNINRKDSE